MKLSQVLSKIGGSENEKTASASSTSVASTEKAAQTAEKLKAALKEATEAPIVEKQAATQGSPVADLTKLAGEVLGAEHEALVKEAQLYGTAVCDGFMARLAMYDAAAEKIAAQQPTPTTTKVAGDDSFEKYANENPELVKEAMGLGYERTLHQMDKLAEAAYRKGYDQAVGAIYKTAHATFVQGFEDAAKLVQELRA